MQTVSKTYTDIWDSKNYRFEVKLLIGDQSDPETEGIGMQHIRSMETNVNVFGTDGPSAGTCVSGEIDVELMRQSAQIPRMAALKPYYRIVSGSKRSEWLPKGVYYIDTRETNRADGSVTIHGYDAMLKTEQDFDLSGHPNGWPLSDIATVRVIAQQIGVAVDARTVGKMTRKYSVELPTGYSCREVLGYIAAMYAGNFVMNDSGELMLVCMADSADVGVSLLCNGDGDPITFGGDAIIV